MPSEEKSTKYKDVGIDIKKIKKIQNQIGKNIEKTHQYLDFGKVISGFGHYAGLIEIGDKVMAHAYRWSGNKNINSTINGKV